MSFILLLFISIIVFLIVGRYGKFERQYYARHTSVRSHHRKGTRNGVREHSRRISDGSRLIWVPHPAPQKKESDLLNLNNQPKLTSNSQIKLNNQPKLTSKNQIKVNLKLTYGEPYIFFSVKGKLFIFDRRSIHKNAKHIYLFTNQDHTKTEFNLSIFDDDAVKNVTHQFNDRHILRYDKASGNNLLNQISRHTLNKKPDRMRVIESPAQVIAPQQNEPNVNYSYALLKNKKETLQRNQPSANRTEYASFYLEEDFMRREDFSIDDENMEDYTAEMNDDGDGY